MEGASELVRLQEIDLELLRLRRQAEELPQKERIAKIRKAAKQVQSELTRVVGRRKDIEMEMADLDAERSRVSALVDEAQARAGEGEQDFRALKDLEGQLTAYAKRLEKIDYDEEATSAELDRTLDRERQARDWLERAEAEEGSLLESYKGDLAAARTRMEELAEERREVASGLDESLVRRYVETSRKFKGLAVETLNGNKPSICRVAIAPGQYQDLKRQGEVCTCPYCRRILVMCEA